MRRRATALVLALSAALGTALLVAPPVSAQGSSVLSVLQSLTVAPERTAGYDRDLFPHWDYLGDDCDVRDRVLIIEAVNGPSTGKSCPVGTGRWFSAFDGVTVRDPSLLDVDHFVSGAATASGILT